MTKRMPCLSKMLQSSLFITPSLFLPDQSETQRVVTRVVDRYEALGAKLSFREEELEAYLNLSRLLGDKLRALESLSDWLSGVQSQLDTQTSVSTDLHTLEGQLSDMKVNS